MYENGAQCWVQIMSWLLVKVEYLRGHFHELKVFVLEIFNTHVFKVFPMCVEEIAKTQYKFHENLL